MCNWLKSVIMDSGAAGSARDVRSNGSPTAAQEKTFRVYYKRETGIECLHFKDIILDLKRISALSSILYVGSET